MRIRTLLTAAAAVIAVSGTAWAETDTAGYVGGQFVYTDVETDFGDDSSETGIVEGVASFPIHGNFGGEIESSYAFADGQAEDVWTIAGHAFNRTAAGLIGGFVAATTSDDDTAWTVGAEGDLYLTNATVGGQVSYTNIDDADADVWAAYAHYRHYALDDWYVQGDVGVGNISVDAPGVDDATFWTVGASTEYRFAGSQFSVNAGVNYLSADDFDYDATSVTVGIRYNFDNDGSLRRRDTHGPSLRVRTPALIASSSSGSSDYTPPDFDNE